MLAYLWWNAGSKPESKSYKDLVRNWSLGPLYCLQLYFFCAQERREWSSIVGQIEQSLQDRVIGTFLQGTFAIFVRNGNMNTCYLLEIILFPSASWWLFLHLDSNSSLQPFILCWKSFTRCVCINGDTKQNFWRLVLFN